MAKYLSALFLAIVCRWNHEFILKSCHLIVTSSSEKHSEHGIYLVNQQQQYQFPFYAAPEQISMIIERIIDKLYVSSPG